MSRQPSTRSISPTILMTIVLACLAISPGCGKSPADSGQQDQIRAAMKLLGLEYGKFLVDHNAPPDDERALRIYLESRMNDLSAYGVKSVDDLLRNGRDGKPLQIIYGKTIAAPDRPDFPWAAYEHTGVDGTRLAVHARGGVQELDAAQFSQHVRAN
jgi:hypothetical protein